MALTVHMLPEELLPAVVPSVPVLAPGVAGLPVSLGLCRMACRAARRAVAADVRREAEEALVRKRRNTSTEERKTSLQGGKGRADRGRSQREDNVMPCSCGWQQRNSPGTAGVESHRLHVDCNDVSVVKTGSNIAYG